MPASGDAIAAALRRAVESGITDHERECNFVPDAIEQLIASDEFAALCRKAELLEILCNRRPNKIAGVSVTYDHARGEY